MAEAGKYALFKNLATTTRLTYISTRNQQLSESDRNVIQNSCLTNCNTSYTSFCNCFCSELSHQVTKSDVLNFEKNGTDRIDPVFIDKTKKIADSCLYTKDVFKSICLFECRKFAGINYCNCSCTGLTNQVTKNELITYERTGIFEQQSLEKLKNIRLTCIKYLE